VCKDQLIVHPASLRRSRSRASCGRSAPTSRASKEGTQEYLKSASFNRECDRRGRPAADEHYTAGHWRGAWVGFDLALLGAFAATAWAAWRERQALIILLTVTGTLLCCDAWFDIILDLGTRNIWESVASAALAELPLAFIMFTAARRLVRMSVGVVMQLEGITGDVPPLWKIPLFAEGLAAALPARYRAESQEPKPPAPAPVE
jgi:hypothetical protein